MNIKPKAQIGEIVNIVGCDCIQTSRGFSVVHLTSKSFGKLNKYYVHDVKVEISLKTGEMKYTYLIGTSEEMNNWFHGGWISERNIELAKIEEVTA